MSKETVGFIGVGVMGNPMAQQLLNAGYSVLAHDVSAAALAALVQAGAKGAGSLREVVDQAQIVFTSLPSPAIFAQVAREVAEGNAVKIMVDLSTVGSRATKAAAAVLRQKGIELVDAPVSGGAAGAKAGTLAVMVAGAPAAVEKVKPLLELFGKGKLFSVGPEPGQAQLLKLLNNMLSTTAFAITSEAFVAGVKGGLDPQVMMSAINAGSGRSGASQDKFMKQVLPGTYDFGFPISSVCKDIGLAVEECEALGVPMWIGNAARQVWNFAGAQNGMQQDLTEFVKSVEMWASKSGK